MGGSISCENADGSDNLFNLAPGVDLDLKALCPEKCGHHPGSIPCGHAPKVGIDAIGANWAAQFTAQGLDQNCAAVRAVVVPRMTSACGTNPRGSRLTMIARKNPSVPHMGTQEPRHARLTMWPTISGRNIPR